MDNNSHGYHQGPVRGGEQYNGFGNSNQSREEQASCNYQVTNGPDILVDYQNIDFEARCYGNIASFAHSATPKVSSSRCVYQSNGEVECVLGDIWKSLRNPYGVSVPLEKAALNPFKGPDRAVYYAPLLSGVNLTFAPTVPLEQRKELLTPEVSGSPLVGRDIRHVSSDCTTGLHWFEDQKPEQRMPMFDRMRALSQTNFAGVLSAKSTDFTPTSWFSILWQPIFCQNHTPKRSAGSFLVFYLVRPNPALHQVTALQNSDVPSPVFKCDRLSVDAFWTGEGDKVPVSKHQRDGSEGGEETSNPSQPSTRQEGESGSQSTQPHGVAAANVEGIGSSSGRGDSLGGGAGGGLLETASRGSSDGAVPPHCIPICGMVPLRARSDIWFNPVQDVATAGFTHICPLFLVVSAMQLMSTSDTWVSRWMEDYYFFMKHERFLADLARQSK